MEPVGLKQIHLKTIAHLPFPLCVPLWNTAWCVIMCLFRFGQSSSTSVVPIHNLIVQLVCATALCPGKRCQLADWSPFRKPLHCGLGAKVVHVGRFATAARAHGQSNGTACPSDAHASGGEPFGELGLPRSSSTESGAKGAVPHQWEPTTSSAVAHFSVWELNLAFSQVPVRCMWPLLTSILLVSISTISSKLTTTYK